MGKCCLRYSFCLLLGLFVSRQIGELATKFFKHFFSTFWTAYSFLNIYHALTFAKRFKQSCDFMLVAEGNKGNSVVYRKYHRMVTSAYHKLRLSYDGLLNIRAVDVLNKCNYWIFLKVCFYIFQFHVFYILVYCLQECI